MVFSLFLRTANMLRCVQTQKVQITPRDYSLMFKFQYSVQNTKSSVHFHPLDFAQNAPEGPVLDPVLEIFPQLEGTSVPLSPLKRLHPVTSALPKTRIHY